MAVDVKDAVKAAVAFVQEMYPAEEIRALRLEEVDFDDPTGSWLITLGWVDQAIREGSSPFASLSAQPAPRVYKVFEVSSATGNVVSMKIRESAK